MEDEMHNAIPIGNELYALAWDIRCEECKNGQKHFAKEFTREEIITKFFINNN